MTLAIACSAVLLFGGAGAWQLRNEEGDLETVARNEALLVGRALQTAFENALRDRQIEDVTETLDALEHVDPAFSIFVFDEEGTLVGASASATPSSDVDELGRNARHTGEPLVEFVPSRHPELLRVGLRLREESPASASAIVLEKPLVELRRDIDVTRRNIFLTVLFFVVAVAGLTWVLTRQYVGRPLGELVAQMRLVRAGKLELPHDVASNDEVGDARREFSDLVKELESAQKRAANELDTRQRLERGLRDADKLITLGQLSAVLAHEIGSPLQVVEGRARSMLKRSDKETVERVVPLIVEQTERITRIVQQMLSMTRRKPPSRHLVDAAKAARSVVELLKLEARGQGVTLTLDALGDTTLWADADQLQQVVLNLARNAIQAAPRDTTVEVTLTRDADEVVLEVRDHGAGVPDDLREKLFEPFFTTRAESGGSGLGLSVVRTIVLEHHGQVQFVSQPVGALVRVNLPHTHEES